jgi:hypothetical protein
MFFSKAKKEKRRLFDKYLTDVEKKELAIKKLIPIVLPTIFAYLFLIINGGISLLDSRAFFYIPFLVIIVWSIVNKVRLESKLLVLVKERELSKEEKE